MAGATAARRAHGKLAADLRGRFDADPSAARVVALWIESPDLSSLRAATMGDLAEPGVAAHLDASDVELRAAALSAEVQAVVAAYRTLFEGLTGSATFEWEWSYSAP